MFDNTVDWCIENIFKKYAEYKEKKLRQEIDEKMKPFEEQIKLLDTIPGVDKVTAQVIIAEATTETKNFENERIFASWAGVVPGNNESGGKKKDQNADKVTHR